MGTYIWKNDQENGPFEDSEVQQSLTDGTLSYDDLAWQKGLADWQPLRTLYPPQPKAKQTQPSIPSVVAASPQPQLRTQPIQASAATVPRVAVAKAQREAASSAKGKTKIVTVIAGIVILSVGWYYFNKPSNSGEASTAGSEHHLFTSAPKISSIEDARKHVIGVWTFTGQAEKVAGETRWEKLVIKDDGTFERYDALATSDGWGEPSSGTYQAITGKYSDTGERYYGIAVTGDVPIIIAADGHLTATVPPYDAPPIHMPGYTKQFARGDKNPFSK